MNVLLVQPQFEEPIITGRKLHSVRPNRRDGRPRARVGETLSIRVWTGLPYRSRQREVAQAVVTEVVECLVGTHGVLVGAVLQESESFAVADGFANWSDLADWFASVHGSLPFEGTLIRWRLLR